MNTNIRSTTATTDPHDDHLVDVIANACYVAGHDREIRSVHVVTNRHPTYRELIAYRNQAAACGLDLRATNFGEVTIRGRNRLADQDQEQEWKADRPANPTNLRLPSERAAGLSLNVRIRPAVRWLGAHAHAWSAVLRALNEGTR